ncbi:YwqG family protein [Rufibacter hautae]|uniref:DUF1963 domain-containing protein n=1 Tax=Rufibacter hautae TaxID=2595005 RepID=A0A5B6TIE3_9BACT|nr:YwqG family protein [Rufibacter hautae]KAA3440043.1 DUF1963 domain-containing protein [Rufibacter hautae]
MTKAELDIRLQEHSLDHYFQHLEPHIRNTIRLYLTPASEESIKLGQSKIGGLPDLPPSLAWVTETGMVKIKERKFLLFSKETESLQTKPLSFIAQINLAEVAPFDTESLLPRTGILYFFYSAEQEAWGFDIGDENKFKVLYFDGDLSTLHRAEAPSELEPHALYSPCTLTPVQEISLPSNEHEIYSLFTEEESDLFFEHVYDDGNINKLLGYSDNVQSAMELECELVTNGLYCGNSSGYDDPKAQVLAPNAVNWRLLLQIDSNEDECGMMWGDMGRLYFWIKKQGLLEKNFDLSWLILQCC